MNTIHNIQIRILRELLYLPNARFSELNDLNMSNDHFSYHIRTLIQEEYVLKKEGRYFLTKKGKEFANRMDTQKLVIEKQGKVAVFIIATMKKGKTKYLLIQTRQKEPFFGFNGFVTGKVRFGETLIEAARREFLEETGLSADFKYIYLHHEHVYSKEGELLEDKFFNVIHAYNIKGKLKNTRDGKNEWMTEKQFLSLKNLYYDEVDILNWFKKPLKGIIEKKYVIEKF